MGTLTLTLGEGRGEAVVWWLWWIENKRHCILLSTRDKLIYNYGSVMVTAIQCDPATDDHCQVIIPMCLPGH
jgi:hypothetical protein